jgi:transcriptional regulator with XRE-family HTH domain
LTQGAAAKRCRVSASTYAAIERAERDVRDSTLRDLGRGLGFDAAGAYWGSAGTGADTVVIDGTIRRIERTETEEGYLRTVFEVEDDEGCWKITQERTNPPGGASSG